jgi:hypothetical protein
MTGSGMGFIFGKITWKERNNRPKIKKNAGRLKKQRLLVQFSTLASAAISSTAVILT